MTSRSDAPACACGCGQPVNWNARDKRWNRYRKACVARTMGVANKGRDLAYLHEAQFAWATAQREQRHARLAEVLKDLEARRTDYRTAFGAVVQWMEHERKNAQRQWRRTPTGERAARG